MKRCLVCDCNRSMPMDGAFLGRVLSDGAPLEVHHALCRSEVGRFEAAVAAADADVASLVVACTQESALFREVAAAGAHPAVPLRFVNLRETAGWSTEAAAAGPKMAALLAQARIEEPAPAAGVAYATSGTTLIVGEAGAAMAWADRLAERVPVFVLATGGLGQAALPNARSYPVMSGSEVAVTGWLGKFDVRWRQANPIDLEACTRCNACAAACPEGAIGAGLQVDLDRCRGHRACVTACGEVGAIDFARADGARHEHFDLVLDLSREPLLRMSQTPQGYFAPGDDPLEQALAVIELTGMAGEFDKPRFVDYNPRICAHERSGKPGCNRCIDVCSTQAISPAGDGIRVEAHLCMGCGGCATVCPTGALTHRHVSDGDVGARLRASLRAYRDAGGRDACVLIHDGGGETLILEAGREGAAGRGPGLPARVIPVAAHHVASVGLESWLAALAWGAAQVRVLLVGSEAPEYAQALKAQVAIAEAITAGMGYGDARVALLEAADAGALTGALARLPAAAPSARAAAWQAPGEKRRALEFAFEHLATQAPRPVETLALPPGSPLGEVRVDRDKCTLCLACVGACPASALLDNPETPQLRFVERNCVQCGLCVATCPEDAISLAARLNLAESAKKPVVLNEAEPFHCVRCAKPFGTRQMVERMSARLSAHAMFADGAAIRRLSMCADCRVVDMMENPREASILGGRK